MCYWRGLVELRMASRLLGEIVLFVDKGLRPIRSSGSCSIASD